MKGLIKALFKYMFLFLVILAIVFAGAYFYRDKTLPVEMFVQDYIMPYLQEDTTGVGLAVSGELTPFEELNQQIKERMEVLDLSISAFSDSMRVITQKQDSVKSVRAQILGLQTQFTAREDSNLSKLAKIYESMKPAQASQILIQLNDQTIAELLKRMKDRQSAKILGTMDPMRAADITNRMRRLQTVIR